MADRVETAPDGAGAAIGGGIAGLEVPVAEDPAKVAEAPAKVAEAPVPEPPIAVPSATFRIMAVASVALDLPEQYPVLTLEESEGDRRRLAFRIGMAEGVAISHALHGTAAPRPLTHDVFAEVLVRLKVDVVAVRLVGRHGATYLAELELMGPRGREVVGCRPTDGIALALRQRVAAPVLADDRLLAGPGDVPAPVA